ncbi:hypothetical protein AMTR_s00003p00240200 [Amborella trichopoda]|uniref:Uncharacterized protein n=1 Tax=Amborella trichopoda TaxID=13333 RepID=W1P6N6_AMBTC|nr:hypothetical protein AMTR_s00003p00240200 [Amborella trichopoda]
MGATYRSSRESGVAARYSFQSVLTLGRTAYDWLLGCGTQFLGRDKEDDVRRSAVSGKKILLKLDKSKEDKLAENNRNKLLKFLNASYD